MPKRMILLPGQLDRAKLHRAAAPGRDAAHLAGRRAPYPAGAANESTTAEQLNADQRRELEGIFRGRKGGPMALFTPLYTKWLPTQGAKIDVQEQGGALAGSVGRFGQIKLKR
jgi:hypothetical protein